MPLSFWEKNILSPSSRNMATRLLLGAWPLSQERATISILIGSRDSGLSALIWGYHIRGGAFHRVSTHPFTPLPRFVPLQGGARDKSPVSGMRTGWNINARCKWSFFLPPLQPHLTGTGHLRNHKVYSKT